MAFGLNLPLDAPRVQNALIPVIGCAASCLDAINLSAVNIALPTIANDLGLTQSTLPWLIAAYAIAFAAFLLPAGKFGDLYGYRLVFSTGLAIFAITSLINAVSVNPYMLFVFRALQGEAGTVGAVYNTASQLGSAVGLAIMTAVITGINKEDATVLDLLAGYHGANYVGIGLCVIIMVVGFFFIKDDKPVDKVNDAERGSEAEKE
ncbi:hypothetical protein BZG36_03035 [Bifiguratus adelaidae]|uniref:Major facilitator superfamily (MFS) profile domain-containing protein n=1 Tax=Bifiguratus adelaidae TaxID=1938954 RepID=A0A261XZ21_9FUNG|nr:hypothetical protein BZG36_03035 [Bifiguratus adelaidae]